LATLSSTDDLLFQLTKLNSTTNILVVRAVVDEIVITNQAINQSVNQSVFITPEINWNRSKHISSKNYTKAKQKIWIIIRTMSMVLWSLSVQCNASALDRIQNHVNIRPSVRRLWTLLWRYLWTHLH